MAINNYNDAIQAIKDALDFLNSQTTTTAAIETVQKNETIETIEFEQLKSLLKSSAWPEAVPDYLICKKTDDKDKMDRAYGIIEMIDYILKDEIKNSKFKKLENKKILDFGCGEGHLTKALAEMGANSFGFDIEKKGDLTWEKEEGGLITTDWNRIKEEKDFDVVVLYDVLDHSENPIDVLNKIKEVSSYSTYIFCRCHPWTSPHAGHYYQELNKAYIQLIFTEDEIIKLGLKPNFSQKTYLPLNHNEKWFKETDLKSIYHSMQKVELSDFFKKNKIISKRLSVPEYKGDFPEWQMSQAFNDYVLSM
jgi:2-polyprenyl-3-methyl-5-hydroxy-6-metoxy-1,4-benzoquinol methylase